MIVRHVLRPRLLTPSGLRGRLSDKHSAERREYRTFGVQADIDGGSSVRGMPWPGLSIFTNAE